LQGQNEMISNFRDENSNCLYLQGRTTYLSLLIISYFGVKWIFYVHKVW